jgi:hypothetical protein
VVLGAHRRLGRALALSPKVELPGYEIMRLCLMPENSLTLTP